MQGLKAYRIDANTPPATLAFYVRQWDTTASKSEFACILTIPARQAQLLTKLCYPPKGHGIGDEVRRNSGAAFIVSCAAVQEGSNASPS